MKKIISVLILTLTVGSLYAVDRITRDQEYFAGTSGGATTHTLSGNFYSQDFCITNDSSTASDSLTFELSPTSSAGFSAAVTLYGGDAWCTNSHETKRFRITAVSGTPAYRIIANVFLKP